MKISSLERQFKQFALLEKGMTPGVHRSILYSLRMLQRYLRSEDLSAMSPDAVRSFLYYGRQERGWAPKTYRNHWQYLKTFFDFCRLRGLLASNPLERIEKPRLAERLPRCLSRDDALRVLACSFHQTWRYAFEATRNHTIICTLMMTGLRLQELLNLEVHDLDLSAGSLFVRKGKGSKDRLVPIHPKLLPILRRYIEEKRRYGRPSRWLYTGVKSDKQLNQKDIRRICQRISIAARVKFTPHMLRHTFGRELADNGVDIKIVQKLLGHAQVTTTEIYSRLSTQPFRENFQRSRIY